MRGKVLLVLGLGVGYVLGARAGREKYDELVDKVQKFWNDPRVQKQAHAVGDFVNEKAPDVAEFVSSNVKKIVPDGAPAKKPAARKSPTPRSTTPKG
jgi:hypothetical protein